MATLSFDSHSFINELTASGIPEKKAEAILRALQRIDLRNVATKQDLLELKAELLKWFSMMLLSQAAFIITVIKLL